MNVLIQSLVIFITFVFAANSFAAQTYVRLKDIARIEGDRENALIGYGLVVGLAGSGDSRRSKSTIRSISNTLREFGLIVSDDDINSRNVAAVMATSEIGSFSERGDRIDVAVSAIGDARSLIGGTLLLTPLEAIDGKTYAVAQGQISVGGYKFEQFGNTEQKNHPTVGIVPKGGTIERDNTGSLVNKHGKVGIVLRDADFATAINITDAIATLGYQAEAIHSGKVEVSLPSTNRNAVVRAIAKIESLNVLAAQKALIIVNERTGTIVSGGDVKVNSLTIAHGNLELSIRTQYSVSQPRDVIIGRHIEGNHSETVVVPDTTINVRDDNAKVAHFNNTTTVFTLVSELRKLGLSTRDIIVILQAADKAGAINGKLILQ
ncbi:flagellar basal body P-ring protein FlgI [Photobacterium sp. GJ3]|uniref:flagellar basal body P-ring protein FlgI n=1 Tax=Photobacterium sp. GJ3 TaxID=2829502 RepID=UPI001B8B1CD2|nr:flagellar basal body P-ring protein FlgI [Photobacterium sp. GJ3]QUJ68512.1 flagellar basal body P-ring protein FlgI [Photobacterium sp. GJ3]